ncbi:hypothetical protein [Halorarius litoreus]|uniref:hypothetical protein n=1 Tax=Halorarius litoreus TaxID=2962676 RepID=UPI0020CD2241|nr:hypothetical protein [Halorarius litoreus]
MSHEIEFGTRSEANDVREEYDELLCSVDDDRRRKTVALVSDTDDETLQQLRTRAAASRADRQGGGGQASLTDGERDRIDFSVGRASVPHARSVKGIARDAGVDDWNSYYDPELTVDEHREVMDRAARDESGARMDAERSDEQRAADLQAQAGSECNHARDHCEHGDPDACEFLREECGLDDSDVETLLGGEEGATSYDDLDGATKGALSRAWQGYKVGVRRLPSILDDLEEELAQVERAAAAIRAIESDLDGEATDEFEALRGHHERLADLATNHAGPRHGQPENPV